jgi:hypothetical protein
VRPAFDPFSIRFELAQQRFVLAKRPCGAEWRSVTFAMPLTRITINLKHDESEASKEKVADIANAAVAVLNAADGDGYVEVSNTGMYVAKKRLGPDWR